MTSLSTAVDLSLDIEVRTALVRHKGDWQLIADKSGVSYSWLSKFVNGHIDNPGYATLKRLRAYLEARESAAAAAKASLAVPSLAAAVELLGGQTKLAAAIGVRQQHVWNWLNRGDAVPPECCVEIERATEGKVTRRDLRPLDWWRIWPELVTADFPIPAEAA